MRGTMILPGETAAGSAAMQPCREIAWHRIGRAACLENHRPKDGIYTTGILPQFTLRRLICSWHGVVCIAALGARNVKAASWKKILKFARSRLSATTYRAS